MAPVLSRRSLLAMLGAFAGAPALSAAPQPATHAGLLSGNIVLGMSWKQAEYMTEWLGVERPDLALRTVARGLYLYPTLYFYEEHPENLYIGDSRWDGKDSHEYLGTYFPQIGIIWTDSNEDSFTTPLKATAKLA